MLDLERFRLLKAMEDKNTPKKEKFSATSEKILSKHQRKETSVMDGGRKDLKKRMFMKVIFAKA